MNVAGFGLLFFAALHWEYVGRLTGASFPSLRVTSPTSMQPAKPPSPSVSSLPRP